MRLFALTAIVMGAFAANSLLNRAALAEGHIDAMSFALIRVMAGAAVLALLARLRPRVSDLGPALALTAYLVGFSLGYVSLDAGVGALLLFAVTQITMLGGAVLIGERPPARRFLGAIVAMAGLVLLMWPGARAVPGVAPAVLMAVAAFGWGLYSLAGRRSPDPLRNTSTNFLLSVPMVGAAALFHGIDHANAQGIALAVVSGAVTSGLGYALWYSVMPHLGAARAAVSMLSVPIIAVIAGAIVLGESLTGMAWVASGVVMAGVAVAVWPQRPDRRKAV